MQHVYNTCNLSDINSHLFGHIRLSELLLHHDCGAFTQSIYKYSHININIVLLVSVRVCYCSVYDVSSINHMQHTLT